MKLSGVGLAFRAGAQPQGPVARPRRQHRLTATGHGKDGAVRLLGAHITGQLDLRGATLTNHGGPAPTNDTGPALIADGLQVGSNAWLTGLTATGHGKDGAVRLLGAHISGQLTVSGQVTNHGGEHVILDLRDARVDGALSLWNESAWRGMLDGSDTAKTRPRLLLDGFTYRAQPRQPRRSAVYDGTAWARPVRRVGGAPAVVPAPAGEFPG